MYAIRSGGAIGDRLPLNETPLCLYVAKNLYTSGKWPVVIGDAVFQKEAPMATGTVSYNPKLL